MLAGSLDLLYVGWEFVALTSMLLIAFFHDRPAPVRHGLRAILTYRLCDVGMLGAVVWLHHVGVPATVRDVGDPFLGIGAPEGLLDATVVGLLLLFATMGKSAQAPLGGWLPRAMEGPTPSSAVFYGPSRSIWVPTCSCAPPRSSSARPSPRGRSSPWAR